MEKVVCALWRKEGEDRSAFNSKLLSVLPQSLSQAGASSIRLNLRDDAVQPASGLVQQWQAPQQDAIVQFWLPSANALFRGAVDDVIAQNCGRFVAWLVAESTVIANVAHPPQLGQRTWGWAQASFITFRTDRQQALRHWHSHHTRVAIETQSNFEYVQNAILCPLTQDAPPYDAFVEECFPAEAMTDPAVFFDAVGDPAKFKANLKSMMDSCAAFLDFERADIIPTSQYDFTDRCARG